MAWCYFGSAKLITWYHFYIINAQLLEVFVHVKAKRGWKLFEIRVIREIRVSPSKKYSRNRLAFSTESRIFAGVKI